MRTRKVEKREPKEKKKRVCVYARVSTNHLNQEDSLEMQKSYYEELIIANKEWDYVGIYYDRGKTGTKETRPGFQKMIADVRAGKIDFILVKSISRFARNTITVLKFARELKEIGVGIFFEKENLNTLTGEGEMLLSVLASIAQEESRSISKNIKWRIKKKFEQGEAISSVYWLLGYQRDEYGDLVIVPEEAEAVRTIFDWYLSGMGIKAICIKLDMLGIQTVKGGLWAEKTIQGMLKNEKYKGDFHLQKKYTPEGNVNCPQYNHGEVDSFYITGNHPAIIESKKWDRVQEMIEERQKKYGYKAEEKKKYQNRYPLSGMLFCSKCGAPLYRKKSMAKGEEFIYWVCANRLKHGETECNGVWMNEKELREHKITEPTIVKEEIINGKKCYHYTSKEKFSERKQQKEGRRKNGQNSGILQGINRPRRTVIQL
ncbi:recombinase family protein [Anaeromicropila populeti]|uniref:Site-specific DNA recombinase n=1 Tax=Anaeromicropila populeti TaxID=37658 RepID=A0A1I6LS83_9FIRM|nr:recombinase family protein [Anaeromicropila populeti]SFS06130.1 Site-specific DNA recombinase [Anaeromicropila populeti]